MGRIKGVLNAKQELTQYTYSLAGDQTSTIYPDQTTVQRRYDELGRLIERKDGKENDDKYWYDGNGNRVGRVDRNEQSFTFVYTNRNFLMNKISDDETISFTYDLTGKRTSMSDGTGNTFYTYDSYNGSLKKVVYPDGRAIAYSYDANNRRSHMQDPFGANVYYSYDEMNRLTGVRTALDEIAEAQYNYTANGQLFEVLQKNNVKSSYTYDGLRLDTLTHRKADQSVIQSFDYNYDLNGNIDARTENGVTHDFTYDELNRIETSTQFAESYTYDSKGNRASYTRNTVFENTNTDLEYDDRDRLTQVTTAEGKTVTYKYNGDNLLYERKESGETTRYYYDGQQVIAEASVVNGQAELKVRYIRGKGLIAAEDAGGTKSYYLHNGHGDVVELRDETGITRLNGYSYDIWENPVTEEENVYNSFRYSGELWDDTTDLQYLRARWYDPSEGRFVNEDTYEGSLTNPLSLNLYTYVSNNPLKYIDPSGHWQEGDEKYSSAIQSEIRHLTSLWYSASGDKVMQNQIHAAANALRAIGKSGAQYAVTRINTFIPLDSALAPNGQRFSGDGVSRGFDHASLSVRTQQYIVTNLDTGNSTTANYVGATHKITKSGTEVKRAPNTTMQASSVGHIYNSNYHIVVNASLGGVSGRNPFINLAPSIDYDILLDIGPNDILVNGTINAFPAYEGYMSINGGGYITLFNAMPNIDAPLPALGLMDFASVEFLHVISK